MYAFARGVGGGGVTPTPTIHSAQYGDESIGCKLICSPQDMVCNNNTVLCALYKCVDFSTRNMHGAYFYVIRFNI